MLISPAFIGLWGLRPHIYYKCGSRPAKQQGGNGWECQHPSVALPPLLMRAIEANISLTWEACEAWTESRNRAYAEEHGLQHLSLSLYGGGGGFRPAMRTPPPGALMNRSHSWSWCLQKEGHGYQAGN